MVRRTKEEALATRDRLLDAAEHVFERHGVARTSLHDIAAAAGVTRGAIYWHFRDKADLFNAMMQRATLPMEEAAVATDAATTGDPIEHLRASFVDALHKIVNDPQVRRVFEIATHKVEYVGELTAVRDRHLQARNECLAHVQRSLLQAMRRGQLTARLPARAAALGLHALIDGLIQNWMLDPGAFDLVRTGRRVLDAYLAGLAREVAAPARATRARRRVADARAPARPAPRALPEL
jgi:TetR/AcrR family acrAB operon transcriptional repressor